MINTLFSNPLIFLIDLICLILAIGIHEFAHAATADHLGDPTPRLQGRVTLNPLKHIDMYGMLFILFFGFGWGKPVQFDPYNLKNTKKDTALISLAGPASNVILAIVSSILLRLFIFFKLGSGFIIGLYFLKQFIVLNLILAIFNLLPIDPLDGFKVVGGLLPHEKAVEWYQLKKYGMIFLLLLIVPFNGVSMLSQILDPILSLILPVFLP